MDVQIYPINVYGAGGVIFNSAWVNKWANIGVRGVTGSQGVGIKMINGDGSGGGSLSFLNCDATSMSHGWQFGDTEWVSGDPSSSPMTNISLTCCNAGNADVGMEFGRSVWAANLNACHFEESTVGIRIGRMAQGVKLQGCYIADNETGIELGYDSTSGSRIWRNVSLDTCTIRVASGGTGLLVHGNPSATHLQVKNCQFSSSVSDSGYGIDLSGTNARGIQLVNNRFPASDTGNPFDQAIVNKERASLILGMNSFDINTASSESDWVNQMKLSTMAFSMGPFKSIPANTEVPDVSTSVCFKTANSQATTIDDFENGLVGQMIIVVFGDGNTTVDFEGSSLRGNGGVSKTFSQDDFMKCIFDGTYWYCDVTLTS